MDKMLIDGFIDCVPKLFNLASSGILIFIEKPTPSICDLLMPSFSSDWDTSQIVDRMNFSVSEHARTVFCDYLWNGMMYLRYFRWINVWISIEKVLSIATSRIMNPQPAIRAPDEVSVILLHLKVVDSDRTFALFPIDLRESNRRSGAGDDRVPERESSGDDEPDALHEERMLAGGGNDFNDLAGLRVCEGEGDDCGGGKDRRSENFLDFALAGLLVASEDEVALSYLFDGLEGDSCRSVGGRGGTC